MILRQAFLRDLPNEQEFYDYGARTDMQPVYYGHAPLGTAESTAKWVLFFFTYNDDGSIKKKFSLEGAWDQRVNLFASYAV